MMLKRPAIGDEWRDDFVAACLGMFGITAERAQELAHKPLDLLEVFKTQL